MDDVCIIVGCPMLRSRTRHKHTVSHGSRGRRLCAPREFRRAASRNTPWLDTRVIIKFRLIRGLYVASRRSMFYHARLIRFILFRFDLNRRTIVETRIRRTNIRTVRYDMSNGLEMFKDRNKFLKKQTFLYLYFRAIRHSHFKSSFLLISSPDPLT